MAKLPSEDEFTLQIGRALSIFGSVEMSLANLFCAAVGGDHHTVERVFWAVNSLEVRTAMTAAAFKCAIAKLPPRNGLQPLWDEIAKALPKLASKRAELAHGNYLRTSWVQAGRVREDVYFAPYYGKQRMDADISWQKPRWDPRPKKRLYVADLKQRAREFSEANLKIMHLDAQLSGQLEEANLQRAKQSQSPSPPARPSASRRRKETPQRRKRTAD